jgi:putative transcriptional regulator
MDHSLLFEWDEAKSNRNRADRGFDFEYACQIFVRPVLEEDDRRRNYGESRIIATGEIGTETFVVLYSGAATGAGSFPRVLRRGENAMPTVRRSLSEIVKSRPRADLARIRKTTDEEIDAMIAADADMAPDMSRRDWRRIISPRLPDVRAIRRGLGFSQKEFARRFGFSVRTVQEWEQGRAVPDRPARILLRVIEKSPKAVERAVAAG